MSLTLGYKYWSVYMCLLEYVTMVGSCVSDTECQGLVCVHVCYDIKTVRTKEGKFYWKIPLNVDNAAREK